MKRLCVIAGGLLLFWFTLDMTGFAIGGITLVEPAWDSIDGIWWIIYLKLLVIFVFKDKVGKYLLSGFLLLWVLIQFYSHWYYTLFGASEEKIISYNRYFNNTYHIISQSKDILIPDFYHIVLHILILATLFCLSFFIINKKETN